MLGDFSTRIIEDLRSSYRGNIYMDLLHPDLLRKKTTIEPAKSFGELLQTPFSKIPSHFAEFLGVSSKMEHP